MDLNQALTQIAERYNLNAAQLIEYANEDTVGGYEPDNPNRKWTTGSLFEVEGKVLYALARAIDAERIAELGSHHGCSATHFTTALTANDLPFWKLYTVDYGHYWESNETNVERVFMDAVQWIREWEEPQFDILFEDLSHGSEQVKQVWEQALKKVRPGGFIISHDAMHYLVGADVRNGIGRAMEFGLSDVLLVDITPSDCGLAIHRIPESVNTKTEPITKEASEVYAAPKKPRKPRTNKAAK